MTEIKTETYARKSFPIECVQVTEENMDAIADWCGGTVMGTGTYRHIKLEVPDAKHVRQTKAHAGDWVTFAGTGFKIFSAKAFEKHFDKVVHGVRGSTALGGRIIEDTNYDVFFERASKIKEVLSGNSTKEDALEFLRNVGNKNKAAPSPRKVAI